MEKTPVDAVYNADGFFAHRFWDSQGGQDGRKASVWSAHESWIPRRSASRWNLGLCGKPR